MLYACPPPSFLPDWPLWWGGQTPGRLQAGARDSTRLVRLGVSSRFLFGHFGVFKFIPNLRVVARREANTAEEEAGREGTLGQAEIDSL